MASLIEPSPVGAGDHVVQFYAGDADLVARAGAYLSEGVRGGAVAIVIATEAHREAFEAYLRAAGVDVDAAREDGTVAWLDAAATLARFAPGGRVDRDRFFAVIGGVVRAAAATGRPVRAYGEMVALLWDAGDVMAAIELEALWNELATEIPFSLYCAYHSEAVSGHEQAEALERVCHLHSTVVPAPAAETTWQFAAEPSAPGDARRLGAEALRRMGHGGALIDDALIVITELAANAVVHACSPFSVSIRGEGSTVRILVRDRSSVVPAIPEDSLTRPSGRGLRLISALASRWGVDPAPDGKAVWAELAA